MATTSDGDPPDPLKVNTTINKTDPVSHDDKHMPVWDDDPWSTASLKCKR
eukprot:CAMPEP_0201235108 /NCGR_PEP_ID=MMETSP0852-20130820/6794_1 /ASSEMBLY_ACC=CAM_ASM_000632 /TAXON_ID=183588 /ORGANISM="Pseudo-nitzschia fraudulenta, Strain WWA7" /LENGTH=49 /DNA_ID= /DNA_START= /DNA_END= /DNA_ORIENTATION=